VRPDYPTHFKRSHPGAVGARLDITLPDEPDPPQVDAARWLAQLQADVAQSLGGMLLRGTRPVQLGSASNATSQPSGGAGRLTGWSLRETSGTAAAVVRFYDGRDTSGTLIATAVVPAGTSSNVALAGNGASYVYGLFVDTSAGTGAIEGAAHIGAAD
jgi:hypothetical protein